MDADASAQAPATEVAATDPVNDQGAEEHTTDPELVSSHPKDRQSRASNLLRQAVVTIACGAVFAILLQITVQNYVVEGDSMWPNVLSGDRVLVDRVAYRVGSPARGDLVVFRFPYSWAKMNLIKRVIGLPGDTVEVQPGVVLVDGHPVREPYIRNVQQYWYGPQRVPPGEYFVLGDNREVAGREVSYDSHQWGFLPAKDIYGRVMVTYWPVSDFHLYGF